MKRPRVEALVEQAEWIASIEGQTNETRSEVDQLEAQLAAERLPWETGPGRSKLDDRALASLRPVAAAVREARHRWRKAQATIKACQDHSGALTRELSGAMPDHEQRELNATLERAGDRVSQLRHRVQMDERLDQFQSQRESLAYQHESLLEKQMLPVWTLGTLGSIFVLGVTLILAGLFLPTTMTGPVGWVLAVIGLGGAIVAGISKVVMEQTAEHQLAVCEKQIRQIDSQIQKAQEERKQLDAQLPRGGGPLLMRLQEAERELAKLEDLVPERAAASARPRTSSGRTTSRTSPSGSHSSSQAVARRAARCGALSHAHASTNQKVSWSAQPDCRARTPLG